LKFAEFGVKKHGQGHQLDRKDNHLGYLPGNVAPCCGRCNAAKGSRYSYEEWWGMTAYFRDRAKPTRKALAAAASASPSLFADCLPSAN
jgi:hypothetical protein